MTFFHLLFLMFLTECFSFPKMFLAGTASLGGGRRFVTAFCEARKNPREVSEGSKGEMLAFALASPCAAGIWGKEAEVSQHGGSSFQSPAGLEEPLLRTPSVPVSQTHKHPPPGGTTPSRPWPQDHVFATPRLSCYNSPRGIQSSQAKNTLVGTKHNILFA